MSIVGTRVPHAGEKDSGRPEKFSVREHRSLFPPETGERTPPTGRRFPVSGEINSAWLARGRTREARQACVQNGHFDGRSAMGYTIGYFHTVMPLVSEADMARGAAPLLRAMHQELLEVSTYVSMTVAHHMQLLCSRTCSAQPATRWLVGRLSALASRATPPRLALTPRTRRMQRCGRPSKTPTTSTASACSA